MHPNAGLTGAGVFMTMRPAQSPRKSPMNTPPPNPSSPPEPLPRIAAHDSQIRAWLKLRRELLELHARLEYLKLMLSLGVRESRG